MVGEPVLFSCTIIPNEYTILQIITNICEEIIMNIVNKA